MTGDHLVLAGGGHTHALVLLRWAMKPHLKPSGLITLINRSSHTIYSGMMPGVIAGKYELEEISINLRDLAFKAGVSFVMGEIHCLDLSQKKVCLVGREPLIFTKLSLDIGSESKVEYQVDENIKESKTLPIKPFINAVEWIRNNDPKEGIVDTSPFAVVGAGLCGLEIAFALRKRWPARELFLYAYPGKISSKLKKILVKSRIHLRENTESILSPALICIGNKGPTWIKESGLNVNKKGRIITENTLQSVSDNNVFAVGDCGVVAGCWRPPSGVWAVRAAKPLAENLERLAKGLPLRSWRSQQRALQLLSVSFDSNHPLALAVFGRFVFGPSSLFAFWKEKIDRDFITKFNNLLGMNSDGMNLEKTNECRGCAAKLSAISLQNALMNTSLKNSLEEPEDASFIGRLDNGQSLIQSVDGFPPLVSDPWLNGRLMALHACSDIWSSGAKVVSAQVLITLPQVNSKVQEELLAQTLNGINSALLPQGAKIIGGHTLESRNPSIDPITLGIDIGLSVNGLVREGKGMWSKGGLKKGDQILISRSIGSGVLFAAAMHGMTSPYDIDSALRQMSESQHDIISSLIKRHNKDKELGTVHASTDITGFGLLGHLSEMLRSSNNDRISKGMRTLKMCIEIEKIESYNGAMELFDNDFESSLAPSNRNFLRFIKPNYDPNIQFEIIPGGIELESKEFYNKLELMVDPQTCGPIVIGCGNNLAEELIKDGPWKRIGYMIEK